jgi:hypothetical protein
MRRLSLIAAAFTLALAATASAATVADPDEPGFAQDADIEWASSSWWGPPGSVIITHTIKTYGAYTHPPCLVLHTYPRRRMYSASSSVMEDYGTRNSVVIGVRQTASTVTYTFVSSQIGNPRYYRWRAEAGGPYGDRTAYTREDMPQPPYVIDDDITPPLDPPDLP